MAEGGSEGDDVAGAGLAGAQSGQGTFQVPDFRQGFAEIFQQFRVLEEGVDGIQAFVDGGEVACGTGEPLAESTGTHRGNASVQHAIKGGVAWGVGTNRFEDFEVPESVRIELEEAFAGKEAKATDVGEVAA